MLRPNSVQIVQHSALHALTQLSVPHVCHRSQNNPITCALVSQLSTTKMEHVLLFKHVLTFSIITVTIYARIVLQSKTAQNVS
jgi:hypothetical protein